MVEKYSLTTRIAFRMLISEGSLPIPWNDGVIEWKKRHLIYSIATKQFSKHMLIQKKPGKHHQSLFISLSRRFYLLLATEIQYGTSCQQKPRVNTYRLITVHYCTSIQRSVPIQCDINFLVWMFLRKLIILRMRKWSNHWPFHTHSEQNGQISQPLIAMPEWKFEEKDIRKAHTLPEVGL